MYPCFTQTHKNRLEIDQFKPISLEDQALLSNHLNERSFHHNELTFLTLYAWNETTDYRYAICKGVLFLYSSAFDYLYNPIGRTFTASELFEFSMLARAEGKSGRFILMDKEYIDSLPNVETYFRVVEDRDNADYIYSSESLATLKGRHLSKKRNLITQFHTLYPQHEVVILSEKNVDEALALVKNWQDHKEPDHDFIREYGAIQRSFNDLTNLGQTAIGIRIEGELKAFALFSNMTYNMSVINFEKADPKIKGLSQVINQETAKLIYKAGIPYINREQDLGIEGLRQAKLSYMPERLIESYKLLPKLSC